MARTGTGNTTRRRAGKRYDAFISFADPDRKLGEALYSALLEVGLDAHFAPKDLPQNAPSGWKAGIVDSGIGKSKTFILVGTRAAICRSWVLFEAGAAAALGVKCYHTRVQGVTDSDFGYVPDTIDHYNYRLFDWEELRQLFRKVAEDAQGSDCRPIWEKIDKAFARRAKSVADVIARASTRWVFIAGNMPRGGQKAAPERAADMRRFVNLLTQGLLEAGFCVAACPQVKDVGQVVLKTAEAYVAGLAKTGAPTLVDYRIGGLFPLDRMVRNRYGGARPVESKWREHLMQFRKSYLYKHEWLVLVGGSEGTAEEYEAVRGMNGARQVQIKTLAVPCFGGTGANVYRELKHKRDCCNLKLCEACRRRAGGCPRVSEIVEQMKGG